MTQLGFNSREAMEVVRPEVAAKLEADAALASPLVHEQPPCDLLPFDPVHGSQDTTKRLDGLSGVRDTRSMTKARHD